MSLLSRRNFVKREGNNGQSFNVGPLYLKSSGRKLPCKKYKEIVGNRNGNLIKGWNRDVNKNKKAQIETLTS